MAAVDVVRTLPHDLDAERAVLGACLVDEAAWAKARGVVAATDFFREAHRRIAAAFDRLVARAAVIDFVPLCDELRRDGGLDEVGGPSYIAALLDGVPKSSNVVHYGAVVREKARLRELITAANWLLAESYEGQLTPAVLQAQALAQIGDVRVSASAGAVTVDTAVQSYIDGLERTELQPVATGFLDVDALTGGLRPTDLTIIAARPNVGKTVYGLGIADYVTRHGVGCGYFSPEMKRERLAATLMAWECHVPTAAVERRTATQEEWGRFAAAFGAFTGRPLYIDDGSRSVGEVAAWARRLKREHAITCVIVDYLQKLLPATRGRSREEEVAGISSALKALAIELDVAVVALSQLGRASEDRRDKRPTLADLRESGALEQDADLAILLFREEMHQPRPENDGVAEAIVAKQRQGPLGVRKLAFDKRLGRFLNMAGGEC